GLHRLGLLAQGIILDRLAKPPRVVALVKMVEPGLVIDAVGQLKERDEILGFQIEPLVRAAKEETPVGSELAGCILAQVPAAFATGTIAPKRDRRRLRGRCPEHGFAALDRFSGNWRHGLSGGFAEASDDLL